jgi:hypothetical protein
MKLFSGMSIVNIQKSEKEMKIYQIAIFGYIK